MATSRQRPAASRNIEKAQARWRGMSSRQRSLAQPEGRARRRPGAGAGRDYRVEVRPESEFVSFRTQYVGRKGHIQRVAGKRSSGSWATATWLIGKEDAHVLRGHLIADSTAARKLIAKWDCGPSTPRAIVSEPRTGATFQRRKNRRPRNASIRKAQAARRIARSLGKR